MQEHQKLVARLAKNDTDDFEEIEGRKLYRIYLSYNKFLNKSLDEYLEKHKEHERIYILLKEITVSLVFFI